MNKERGGLMENRKSDVFEEDELTSGEVLLLYGYKPAALITWGAVKCGEKGESEN